MPKRPSPLSHGRQTSPPEVSRQWTSTKWNGLSLSLSQAEGSNSVSQQNRSEQQRESRRKHQNVDPNFVVYSPDDDDSSDDDEYDGYYDDEEEEDEEIESEFLIIN